MNIMEQLIREISDGKKSYYSADEMFADSKWFFSLPSSFFVASILFQLICI